MDSDEKTVKTCFVCRCARYDTIRSDSGFYISYCPKHITDAEKRKSEIDQIWKKMTQYKKDEMYETICQQLKNKHSMRVEIAQCKMSPQQVAIRKYVFGSAAFSKQYEEFYVYYED